MSFKPLDDEVRVVQRLSIDDEARYLFFSSDTYELLFGATVLGYVFHGNCFPNLIEIGDYFPRVRTAFRIVEHESRLSEKGPSHEKKEEEALHTFFLSCAGRG